MLLRQHCCLRCAPAQRVLYFFRTFNGIITSFFSVFFFFLGFSSSSVPFILIVVFHVRSNLTFNNNLMSTFVLRVRRVSHKHKHIRRIEPKKNAHVLRQNGCVVIGHKRVWHSISNAFMDKGEQTTVLIVTGHDTVSVSYTHRHGVNEFVFLHSTPVRWFTKKSKNK